MILSKLWIPIGYFMAYICLKIGFYKSKAKKGKTKGQGADFALSPPAGSKNRQPAQGTKRKTPKKAQPPPRCALRNALFSSLLNLFIAANISHFFQKRKQNHAEKVLNLFRKFGEIFFGNEFFTPYFYPNETQQDTQTDYHRRPVLHGCHDGNRLGRRDLPEGIANLREGDGAHHHGRHRQ